MMHTKEKNNIKDIFKGYSNYEDLCYFARLQEGKEEDKKYRTKEVWDKRAFFWKKEAINKRKGEERVRSAVELLKSMDLLQPDFTVADIGCGPGKFVAEFAKHVRHVVGFDISEKMLEQAEENAAVCGVKNVEFKTCDFQNLDIDKEGYRGAFDLVFTSMTAALDDVSCLIKAMEMSRGYCCNITQLKVHNHLRQQITSEVFGKKYFSHKTGKGFYSLFNLLFLMGYNPLTSYQKRRHEIEVTPDEEYVEFLMEHMLSSEERTLENVEKVREWLKAHTNSEGKIKEVIDYAYGRIIWDVNDITDRPEYE